ncbi:helix-turn-helix domain-containing protein [Lacipirellula limnantheis]|uniref:Helix-turn-helix protein n=1 Tax=Lacipirellula limnantheis TaxID=2528024 RepID=A0A517U6K7_9BACT|nr:helix-turn-helix transcriptional regulator [Lacipirellula limnantheis]QDT76266.1 helix-turn-helix protein [Lacipirellula limnantheis]
MPSLQPYGAKLASLRRALGLTQLELAIRCGVSERTIRNAERGRPVKKSFLEFIAGGLGVTLHEIVLPSGEFERHLRWQRHVDRLLSALQRVVTEHDASDAIEMAHRDIRMRSDSRVPNFSPAHVLAGEYRDLAGIERYVENANRFWELAVGGDDYYVEAPTGGGDVVVIRGGQRFRCDDDQLAWTNTLYVCEFEHERLLRVDQFLTPGEGPQAGVEHPIRSPER